MADASVMNIPQAFALARQHHRAGQLAEAEAIYREILAADPSHADALHLLGVLAGQTGRNEAAVDFIRRAIALRPDHPEAHKNLGVALKNSGQIAESITAYRQAIVLKPDYAEAHKNLGSALYQLRKFGEAIAACRQAIALRPDFAEAHSNLGAALRENGQPDEAIAACRCAIALKPNHPDAYNNLGIALHDKGENDEAIAAYRTALQIRPGFAAAFNNLGIVLTAKGRPDEAIAAYQRAVALKPDYADAFGNLGYALKAQGRNGEAIAAYRNAIALKPDSPDWQHVLAALSGDHSPTTTPCSYIRTLFDSYAGEFDDHLLSQLHYQVPEHLLRAVLSVAPGRRFDVLDLGCGTGLCGVHFRTIAKDMTGVDLSPAMIAKASERGIYDRLITADITEAMREADAFDLILAGDFFIYVGDLANVFAAAARTLRGGGLFAFSLERHDGEGFILHPKVRFAHSLAYVRELSHTHRFEELLVREITLRKSGPDDVAGWVVVLRQTSDPSACP